MSEDEATKQADLKPSERIAAASMRLAEEDRAAGYVNGESAKLTMALLGGPATIEDIRFFAGGNLRCEVRRIGNAITAFAEELDREAERRSAWEKRVEAFARAQGVEI